MISLKFVSFRFHSIENLEAEERKEFEQVGSFNHCESIKKRINYDRSKIFVATPIAITPWKMRRQQTRKKPNGKKEILSLPRCIDHRETAAPFRRSDRRKGKYHLFP